MPATAIGAGWTKPYRAAPVAQDRKPEPAPRKRSKTSGALKAVHPNAGIAAAYQKKLDRLIVEMNRSLTYWITAAYRKNPPEMAMDDSPAMELRRVMRQLRTRWMRNFNEAAEELAKWFATAASERSDETLRAILRRGGMTVKFRRTAAVNDVLQSVIGESVALIKSIPEQHLSAVEGAVMRSVSAGRDLASLTKELQDRFGVTKRRAAFIARDQNGKATAAIQRARQVELSITECIWVHSGGGKEPRPSHVKAGRDKVRYDPKEGWLDPALNKLILPGTEPNCRCVARPVLPT